MFRAHLWPPTRYTAIRGKFTRSTRQIKKHNDAHNRLSQMARQFHDEDVYDVKKIERRWAALIDSPKEDIDVERDLISNLGAVGREPTRQIASLGRIEKPNLLAH